MHWYTREGDSMYEVKGDNGKLRPTTLRDARKLELVPSVTTIINVLAKPGLDRWKEQQLLDASWIAHQKFDQTDSLGWYRFIRNTAKQESEKAMSKGTEIHDYLEKFFKTGKLPKETKDKKICQAVINCLLEKFGENDWVSEASFASPDGFGGKVDLHSPDGYIVDFKTKSFNDPSKVAVYDEHAMQLAAYRIGLYRECKNSLTSQCYNLFISTEVESLVKLHKWTRQELLKGQNMFLRCLEIWQDQNNYDSSWEVRHDF